MKVKKFKCWEKLLNVFTHIEMILCKRSKSSRFQGLPGQYNKDGAHLENVASIPTALCKQLRDLSIANGAEVFDHNFFN